MEIFITCHFFNWLRPNDTNMSVKWCSFGWSDGLSSVQCHSIHRENSPLLKPPQSPHCYLGAVDHAKFFPLTPGHTASPVLSSSSGHSDPIVLKPFDLVQMCHGNKICSKLASTWKLTLELSFPAHCISNWKLNGISRTNISKVTLNAANELPMLQSGPVLRGEPPAGLGGGVKLYNGAWKCGPESPVGMISLWLSVARPSAATVLTRLDQEVFVFHEGGSQLAMQSCCWEMIYV